MPSDGPLPIFCARVWIFRREIFTETGRALYNHYNIYFCTSSDIAVNDVRWSTGNNVIGYYILSSLFPPIFPFLVRASPWLSICLSVTGGLLTVDWSKVGHFCRVKVLRHLTQIVWDVFGKDTQWKKNHKNPISNIFW